ncbi:hypothetical protein [Nonomuraea sp. CA-141351]|uniref:hypothetical protein n=1 Tax=Nonomuraea sp. CA-141351 TaxID=3239996 RepID=UPI003D919A95
MRARPATLACPVLCPTLGEPRSTSLKGQVDIESLSFEEASAVGVNFVTGWLGAVETAELDKGETIAVFGVSGGVGGAVAQIARARGAQVIGLDQVKPASAPRSRGSPAAEVWTWSTMRSVVSRPRPHSRRLRTAADSW